MFVENIPEFEEIGILFTAVHPNVHPSNCITRAYGAKGKSHESGRPFVFNIFDFRAVTTLV